MCCSSANACGTSCTPAQQTRRREAARASVLRQRELWDAQEAKSLAAAKAVGAQIVEVDRAAFRTAVAPVLAKFVNTPELQRLVKIIQDTP